MWVSFFFLAVCLELRVWQIRSEEVNVWWLKTRVQAAKCVCAGKEGTQRDTLNHHLTAEELKGLCMWLRKKRTESKRKELMRSKDKSCLLSVLGWVTKIFETGLFIRSNASLDSFTKTETDLFQGCFMMTLWCNHFVPLMCMRKPTGSQLFSHTSCSQLACSGKILNRPCSTSCQSATSSRINGAACLNVGSCKLVSRMPTETPLWPSSHGVQTILEWNPGEVEGWGEIKASIRLDNSVSFVSMLILSNAY